MHEGKPHSQQTVPDAPARAEQGSQRDEPTELGKEGLSPPDFDVERQGRDPKFDRDQPDRGPLGGDPTSRGFEGYAPYPNPAGPEWNRFGEDVSSDKPTSKGVGEDQDRRERPMTDERGENRPEPSRTDASKV